MSDVRRGTLGPDGIFWGDRHWGTHALMEWEEYKRLRKVALLAKQYMPHHILECPCQFCKAIREMEDSDE